MDERKGSYPGMTKSRTFCVGVIEPGKPVPFDPDNMNALCVDYDGLTCRFGL